MIRNKIISILAICSLATQLYAEVHAIPTKSMSDSTSIETHTEHEIHEAFYMILKGLMVLGDTVPHGHSTLDGDRGYGFGIDLGYMFGNGFAVEYDFSYATNTVKETDEHHHSEKAEGIYYTHSLDLVYAYHLSHEIGIFLKAGYEYEIEEIKDFHIDTNDHGFIFGLGFEADINKHYRLIVEGEKSTIDGPRGTLSLFTGIMYIF